MSVRGDELGGALGKIIDDHLVDCDSFYEKCEVTDTHGNRSKEVDLVFLNRFHPKFLLTNRPRVFYIEGVIAAAEVKTSLNKSETIDCLEKARAFKRLLARVDGKDLQANNFETNDWNRYLVRRPFFAFAYEDMRDLSILQNNLEKWVTDNAVPKEEQIDASFIFNKGVILNLGSGSGAIGMTDANGDLVSGFARFEDSAVTSQLIGWLSLVCPTFASLHPILLGYNAFSTTGYVK